MRLLELAEVQEKLLAQYEMLDGEIPELNMKDSTINKESLNVIAGELGVVLPSSFEEVVLAYDFGELNVGGVFFGQTGSYMDFLIKSNCEAGVGAWWGSGERPTELVMIAGTDGYVLLLNCESSEVVAFRRGEDSASNLVIADCFGSLVRGAGTVHFERKRADDKALLGRFVAEECGGKDGSVFWEELALGIT